MYIFYFGNKAHSSLMLPNCFRYDTLFTNMGYKVWSRYRFQRHCTVGRLNRSTCSLTVISHRMCIIRDDVISERSLELKFLGGNLGTSEKPDTDVTRNNLAITHICKAANRTKLRLDVLLVFENVGLSSEHRVTRLIVRRYVNDGKNPLPLPQETAHLPENTVSTKEGDFMKAVPVSASNECRGERKE